RPRPARGRRARRELNCAEAAHADFGEHEAGGDAAGHAAAGVDQGLAAVAAALSVSISASARAFTLRAGATVMAASRPASQGPARRAVRRELSPLAQWPHRPKPHP